MDTPMGMPLHEKAREMTEAPSEDAPTRPQEPQREPSEEKESKE